MVFAAESGIGRISAPCLVYGGGPNLDGRIHSQNNRYWATTAPDIVEERSLKQMKRAVGAAVRAISTDTCRRAMENLRRGAELCVARNGRHLEHVLSDLEVEKVCS